MTTKLVRRAGPERLSPAYRADGDAASVAEEADPDVAPSTSVHVAFELAQDFAELLGIAPDDEMCVRNRVQRAGGVPVRLEVARLPRWLTRGTVLEAPEPESGAVDARIDEMGHRITHVEEIVTSGTIMAHERALLGEDVRIVLRVRRIVLAGERVVEVNDMVVPADRYELHFSFPAR